MQDVCGDFSHKGATEAVNLKLEGREKLELPVEYEWLSPLCSKCASFGHVDI